MTSLAQSDSHPNQGTQKDEETFKTVKYEEAKPGKPPIPVAVAPPQSSSTASLTVSFARPQTSPQSRSPTFRPRSRIASDKRRDSGIAPTSSTTRSPSRSTADEDEAIESGQDRGRTGSSGSGPAAQSIQSKTSLLSLSKIRKLSDHKTKNVESPKEGRSSSTTKEEPFMGITTDIPTENFMGFEPENQLSFSNRGSILISGKRADNLGAAINGQARMTSTRRSPAALSALRAGYSNGMILSADEQMLSQKVRSMYEYGEDTFTKDWPTENTPIVQEQEEEESHQTQPNIPTIDLDEVLSKDTEIGLRRASSQRTSTSRNRQDFERAGGIEDWQDVDGKDVDRYGFIAPPRVATSPYGSNRSDRVVTPESPRPQRVSTILLSASQQPRKKGILNRAPSRAGTTRSSIYQKSNRNSSNRSLKPSSSMNSVNSAASYERPHRPFRSAANRLPHNKNRRWMDEAGDMLTLPPGLADIAEDEEGGKGALDMKKKEWSREDKWRKMAKVITRTGEKRGGMEFEFDLRDPKLVSRTWKGIPDSWRATAWHAFLTASSKKVKNSQSDEMLITFFHESQEEGSADDVQIDIDVPRTINGHIMFRRRYAGGQRLLFRVLHAISLYFPDVGYVQGMASLAATLLCYYDEEIAFVMMVRLWDLRGLKRLYQSGFEGLMDALNEFEQNWLAGGDVAAKLNELGITSTAYGTRWYLTLFNYSIPFPAQLRVWDVFMLLGDPDPAVPNSSVDSKTSFSGGLDILHATSAALIDGMRDILLDSDFENAMKVLTSWIPIRDEELLMKVAKAEWKQRRRRFRA